MKKNSFRKAVLFSTLIPSLLLLLATVSNAVVEQSIDDTTYDLVHQIDAKTTLKVQTQLQYRGSVIVDNAGQEEDARVLPLDVRAQLQYDQRISAASSTTPQAIRYFHQAEANIAAGKGETETELGQSNRLVLARLKQLQSGSNQFQIASVGGTLTQREYELLKNPGDPLSYTALFNRKKVTIGDSWKLDKNQIASLLAIHRVINGSVSMSLKSVTKSTARIHIMGSVKGEVDDAITEINLQAIAQLNLQDQRVTAFRLTIDEERRSGQVAPGFEGRIKVDARLAPSTSGDLLNEKLQARSHQGKKLKFSFLLNRPASDFFLHHDTRWRVIASEKEAVVLRYMEDGQLIAQCNIVQLPKRPANNPLPMKDFKEEIRKIISPAQARIVASDRSKTTGGLEALRIEVDGIEAGIPFKWLYYHVSAQDGRRLSFVITHETDVIDYFADADRQLIDQVYFKTARAATRPAAQKPRAHTSR